VFISANDCEQLFETIPKLVWQALFEQGRAGCPSDAGFELLSLAERAGDPEQRAELLRFSRTWMSLTEGIEVLLPKLPCEI
jgi:hypothetical protein